MSNLDDVIKDILKNINYDNSKSIYEQKNLISEVGLDGGGDQAIAGGRYSKEYAAAIQASNDREALEKKKFGSGGLYNYVAQGAQALNVDNSPITFRGIQRTLDFIIPKSKAGQIEVLEFHVTDPPYDQQKAVKLFGDWCKAISSGNMTGKSGEDFWYDTTSPELKQCSASTEYHPRTLPGQPDTIDPNFGLMELTQVPFTNNRQTTKESYNKDLNNLQLNEEGGGWISADVQGMRRAADKEKSNKEYWTNLFGGNKKLEVDNRTKQQKEIDKRRETYLGSLKTEKEKEEERKKDKLESEKTNKSLMSILEKNPKYEPYKGWGIYKKNWDCLAGDCRKIGKLVKLPISNTTGKPIYKQFLNDQGKPNVCRPLEYNYCLQISWSLFNGNAQPNGMKKFKFKPMDPNAIAALPLSQQLGKRVDRLQALGEQTESVYIACSSNGKLENTMEKNEVMYPWSVRYDGYCLSRDGENCDSVKKGSYSECETNLNNLNEFFDLDLRETFNLKIPGNKISLYSDNFQNEAKEKYGKQYCKQCIPLIDRPVYTTKNGEEIDCVSNPTIKNCREKVLRSCYQDCVGSGDDQMVTQEAMPFANGSIVFGKK